MNIYKITLFGHRDFCATKNIEYFENYYDDVIIWEGEEKTHPKEAITKRNMWMVENSNLLICFVAHNSGGAYKAMQYANKLGIKTLNLFQD